MHTAKKKIVKEESHTRSLAPADFTAAVFTDAKFQKSLGIFTSSGFLFTPF